MFRVVLIWLKLSASAWVLPAASATEIYYVPLSARRCAADLENSSLPSRVSRQNFRRDGQAILKSVEPLTPNEIESLVRATKNLVPPDLLPSGHEVRFEIEWPILKGTDVFKGTASIDELEKIEEFEARNEIFARWSAYVGQVLEAMRPLVNPHDARLEVVSVQLRIRVPSKKKKPRPKAKMHLDGGGLVVLTTWRGHPTVTRIGHDHLPVDQGQAFLLTGKDYLGGTHATWHGEPLNTPEERFLMVLRIEPKPYSPWYREPERPCSADGDSK